MFIITSTIDVLDQIISTLEHSSPKNSILHINLGTFVKYSHKEF